MASLKNVETDEFITNYVSLKEKQEVIRTNQTLLSGEIYVQRIGSPAVSYNVTAYVDYTGKALLQSAEDTTGLLKIIVNHGTYLGRIMSLSFSERMAGGYFKADIVLAKGVAS